MTRWSSLHRQLADGTRRSDTAWVRSMTNTGHDKADSRPDRLGQCSGRRSTASRTGRPAGNCGTVGGRNQCNRSLPSHPHTIYTPRGTDDTRPASIAHKTTFSQLGEFFYTSTVLLSKMAKLLWRKRFRL